MSQVSRHGETRRTRFKSGFNCSKKTSLANHQTNTMSWWNSLTECVLSAWNAGVCKAHLEEPRSTSVGVPSSDVRALEEVRETVMD